MRLKFMWQDLVVVLGFLLYFGAGFSTNFIITEIGKLTESAVYLEQNPIAREAIDQRFSIFMLQVLQISFMGAIYFVLRRKVIKEGTEANIQLLWFYSVALFLLFLQNFLNDFPIALKMFMGG